MDLDQLIAEAERIRSGKWNSPLVSLYRAKIVKYVSENYGEDYGRVVRNAMHIGVVRPTQESWNQNKHEQRIQGVIDVLEQLKNEEIDPNIKSQPLEKVPAKPSPSNINYHVYGGTVQVGDGNQVNNVTVRDIITEIEQEVSRLPESEEKATVISGLKLLSKNETFANITGAAVGSLLSNLLK
jgi:hypothetical protein